MTEREIDATAIEFTWREGRYTIKSTSFLIEDQDASVVIIENGKDLSAYIEKIEDDDD